MIKANTKYTALEILTEAGFDKPEQAFGKMRVRIGGISGIVKPDHIVRVNSETSELDVIVGIEVKTIKIEEVAEEPEQTEAVVAIKEAQGEKLAEVAQHNREVKDVARKMLEADEAKKEFTPTKQEAKLVEEATPIMEAQKALKAETK